MPSSELVGVKTNIGLVVITNISIFIFLIQVITHLMYTVIIICVFLFHNTVYGKLSKNFF